MALNFRKFGPILVVIRLLLFVFRSRRNIRLSFRFQSCRAFLVVCLLGITVLKILLKCKILCLKYLRISNPTFDYRKDVRLPQNLQRAMAAEAEAHRDAKAKVSSCRLFFKLLELEPF